jgi:hypothetical protein
MTEQNKQGEFDFPVLDGETNKDELKIEIVDDTPPEDRNKEAMPKEVVEEIENDDLTEYSEKVQRRLKQLRKVYHDERREKERIAREREEALRFAEMKNRETEQLRRRLGEGEKVYKDQITKSTTVEIEAAKDKLKKAFETNDPEALAAAQMELNDAQLRLREVQKFQPSALQEEKPAVERQPQAETSPSVPTPDPKADAWRKANPWFGVDEEMTALAYGLHEKLVRSGVDPRSDEYYDKINQTMKKRFPENFSKEADDGDDDFRPAPRKPATTVVAPVARSTAPRQVRLTPTQVALAKKLGLTTEQYARELIRMENTNG